MSYVLQIWQTPVPATVNEAGAICSQLQRRREAHRPEYAELASRLVARYPDIGDLDEEDGSDVWTDGPLSANARAPVFGVGVQTHALNEVVPFVIESARALGLLVYDTQSGRVHLADGRVLGVVHHATQPASVPSHASACVTRADIRRSLRAALGPALASCGFEPDHGDHDFVLHTEAARFNVQFAFDANGDGHKLHVTTLVTPVCREPSGLLERFYPEGTDFLVDHRRLAAAQGMDWAAMGATHGGVPYLESPEDLERSTAWWLHFYLQALLPLVDRCRTLQGLSDELTGNMSAFRQRNFTLTLAAALGRTDLDDIAERLRAWILPHLHHQIDAHLAVLKRRQ